MPETRYSREDLAEMVDRLTRAANEEPLDPAHPELATMQRNGLKVAAAMLSEAANRAPTHAEIQARDRDILSRARASLGGPCVRFIPANPTYCALCGYDEPAHLDTSTPEPGAPQQGHSTWDLPNRARLLHAATTDSREPTTPRDVGVVWYPTLDDIHAAFVAGWAEDGDAVWGGETEDGEEVTFTTDEMLAGIREQGMWGFERGGTIHLWCEPQRARSHDFLHLIAHEIAHSACGHDGTLEDEMEAERYGAVAAQAYRVTEMVAAVCGARSGGEA